MRACSAVAVGNRGLTGSTGRLPGSVPAEAVRQSCAEVLVAHTAG